MATVTGMTAEAIDQLMNEMVVSMRIDENGQMIYKTRGNVESNAGPIIAPTAVLEKTWPVGSIYIGTTPENPATVIGIGTWARYGKGTVLVSQSDTDPEFEGVGQTGGSKTITLAVTNLPAHFHSMANHRHEYTFTFEEYTTAGGSQMRVANINAGSGMSQDRSGNTSLDGGGNTGTVGSATPVNNLQPYTVVYVWKRNS